jgi:hypothetical protein
MADESWDDDLPAPPVWNIGLEGRTWNIDRYYEAGAAMPEKFELIDGKLFWSERERLGMLSAMLEQVGLAAAVRLAPKALWLEALAQLDE